MRCKAFEAVIELEIQAVTCPGVWLCPNGKVTIQIFTLGLCIQTTPIPPVFPLLYHERLKFRKTFSDVRKLNDLEQLLSKETVYIELTQWEDSEAGNVLATFKTSLTDLLYPLPCCKGLIAGVDVDLLMEATKCFPGIIAPKIEVSTKTTIEEVLCNYKNDKKKDVVVINPKIISCKCVPKRKAPLRQKKVCHSYQYHKSKTTVKRNQNGQQFELEALPTSRHSEQECTYNVVDREKVKEKVEKLRSISSSGSGCPCHFDGKKVLCPLCTKYKYYFDKPRSCSIERGSIVLCPSRIIKCNCDGHGDQSQKTNRHCKCDSKLSNSGKQSPKSAYEERCSKNLCLAKEIHERCRRTLSPRSISIPTGRSNKEYRNKQNRCLEMSEASDASCNERFYKSLEGYYKELYKRAHKENKCKQCC